MIGLTWPRYNWTVFDVSGQFGVIWYSFFCFLSVFPVVFLGCLCAFLGHFCVCRALFFEDKFWTALAEPQCCSKLFFKNTGLGFFHFIFVSHCLACSGWQKLSGKKEAPAQKKTPETHRSKPERQQERQRKQKRKKPKWPQIAKKHQKTVQLYLCEVSPNKYVWNPPYYRETKFILLKNIAKRRLPTPLRISGKVKKSVGGRGKVVRGIRGPQGPSRRKTVCFWNPVPEKRSTPVAKQKW